MLPSCSNFRERRVPFWCWRGYSGRAASSQAASCGTRSRAASSVPWRFQGWWPTYDDARIQRRDSFISTGRRGFADRLRQRRVRSVGFSRTRLIALLHGFQEQLRSGGHVRGDFDGHTEREIPGLRHEKLVGAFRHAHLRDTTFVGDGFIWVHDHASTADRRLTGLVDRFNGHETFRMGHGSDPKTARTPPRAGSRRSRGP